MASKNQNTMSARETVEIDREAYERLEGARDSGESVSEVIKRCVRPRQSAEQILRLMRESRISRTTLNNIEESATRRRRTPHKPKGQ